MSGRACSSSDLQEIGYVAFYTVMLTLQLTDHLLGMRLTKYTKGLIEHGNFTIRST